MSTEDEVEIKTFQKGKLWFAECLEPGFKLRCGAPTEELALARLRDGLQASLQGRMVRETVLRGAGLEKAPRHQRRRALSMARRSA